MDTKSIVSKGSTIETTVASFLRQPEHESSCQMYPKDQFLTSKKNCHKSLSQLFTFLRTHIKKEVNKQLFSMIRKHFGSSQNVQENREMELRNDFFFFFFFSFFLFHGQCVKRATNQQITPTFSSIYGHQMAQIQINIGKLVAAFCFSVSGGGK